MTETKRIDLLDNGLTLLTQQVPGSEAASYIFRVPCGTVDDPGSRQGLAGMVSEMIVRGAGDYDNQELVYAFENLGVDSSESVSQAYSSFSAALVADKFSDSLALTADILRRPRFPEEELEPARLVLQQELAGLEDEPARLLFLALGKLFFPAPWGRPACGNAEGLAAVTYDDVLSFYKNRYTPNGAILSVAGKLDPESVLDTAQRLFGDWRGPERVPVTEIKPVQTKQHIPFESAQTHIGLVWQMVPVCHPDYLPLKSAVGVLSGGMSCRLFDEVREKRGLCYTVSASYSCNKSLGAVFCYCGSSSETAQEALDVIVGELHRLSEKGITQTELDRLKIRSKSSLVMSQESTAVRAGLMARDFYYLGRVRSLREILDQIDALTLDDVNAKIAEYPIGPLRMVTLGPEELEIDGSLLG